MQLSNLNPEKITEAFSDIILTASEKETTLFYQKQLKQVELYHKANKAAMETGAEAIPRPDTSKETVDLIELTEAEAGMALMRARQQKSAQIKAQNWAAKITAPITYTAPTIETYREMYLSRLDQYGKPFILDEVNTPVFETLAKYFTKDESCTLKLDKGILLTGYVGTGKTELMDFFKYNFHDSYIITSCRDLTYSYAKHGDDAIKRYDGLINFTHTNLSYGQNKVGVCFDDLGTEDDRKNFGNLSNVMADVLLNRYDNKRNLARKTHITTNLTVKEMEERYGTRVLSRMKEMFNLLSFGPNEKDRRK